MTIVLDTACRLRALPTANTVVLLIILMLLCSCGINTRDQHGMPIRMSKDEFAEYVETVFRHHNGVVNELILATSLSDDPELVLPPALLSAERAMVAACQPLNEVVSATIERRELTVWARLLLIDQVPRCAASSSRVELLMKDTF